MMLNVTGESRGNNSSYLSYLRYHHHCHYYYHDDHYVLPIIIIITAHIIITIIIFYVRALVWVCRTSRQANKIFLIKENN